ncbi:CHAT domain-containing protein [Streptomyces sp. NBC_00690]|uniref:CHAT domain-containing protein n=1 Tax=Streptomyces sp. NBC_00690 TaxID=2975808 RepID=UPI002E2888F9|nr:CHAT domain-containing protein [Streptomyces sp. NBC_00690]
MIEFPDGLPPAPPPGALELATTLSIATRIEPELIRAVRLGLHPHLDVGAEADLWFCEWVGARTHDAIALLPECLPYLRGRLTRRLAAEPGMAEVFTLLSDHHQDLSPALFLEEQITWASLTGDTDKAEQHLGRALHALVREQRSGVAGWFAGAWQRLPEAARTSATAWSLANATRAHAPSLPLGPAPDLTLADVATIAPAVGRVRLGLRREGRNLLIGEVQGPDAVAILVPDTHPRMVEVLTSRAQPPVRIEAGAVVRVPVGPGAVNLRTGGGELYRLDPPGQIGQVDEASEWEVLHELMRTGAPLDVVTPRLMRELDRLITRFHQANEDKLLKEAARLARYALDTNYAPRQQSTLRVLIAETFYLDGLHFGVRDSLDKAVGIAGELNETRPTSRRVPIVLGAALRERYFHSRRFDDLMRSVEVLNVAVEAGLVQEEGNTEAVCELLRTLIAQHEADPRSLNLHRARALASAAAQQIGTPSTLIELALAQFHLMVFGATQEINEFDRAHALITEFCAAPGWPASVQAEGLATRAAVSLALLRMTAGRGDLESALSDLRAAISLTPASRARRGTLRIELGNALRIRFHLLGEHRDLTRAIKELQAVVKRRHRPSLLPALSALTRCQLDDVAVTGDLATVERAIANAREAVALAEETYPAPPRWSRADGLLRESLLAHHRLVGDPAVLDEAVAILAEAERRSTHDSQGSRSDTVWLASALLQREILSPRGKDGRQASRFLDSMMTLHTDQDLTRWQAVLLRAITVQRDPRASTDELSDALRDAAHLSRESSAPPLLRLRADLLRTTLAVRLRDSDAVLRGYDDATHAMATAVLLPGRERADLITMWARLGQEAAAYAIEAGAPKRALAYLEQQSALLQLWNRGADFVTQVLRRAGPSLVTELEWLWNLLHLDLRLGEETRAVSSPDLANRLNGLVDSIRHAPGLESLFPTLDVQQLIDAAEEGPIVVLNPADRRCDALILTGRRGLSVLPLVRLDSRSLTEQAQRYTAAMSDPADPAKVRAALEVLEWLWHNPVRQILHELQLTPRSERAESPARSARTPEEPDGLFVPDEDPPRLWWFPTGAFASLPLHAAGQYDTSRPRTAMDFAVHSYTPGIQALIDGRRQERSRSSAGSRTGGERRMLLVVGDTSLENASREVERIHELIPGATLMTGAEATTERVVAALSDHQFFHFSGHGSHRGDLPSGLHLNEVRLTQHDLPPHDLVLDGALAYLSACDTHLSVGVAEGGAAWSIASAFQAAGYRHVIASLGQITDEMATEIAVHFYRFLIRPDGIPHAHRAAHALHNALRQIDSTRPQHLLDRAALIHLGP